MSEFRVGFAEAEITPQSEMPYGLGPAAESWADVHWPLYVRVALFEDFQSRRAAIVACDLAALMPDIATELRNAVAGSAGLAAADVSVSCTHTHNPPRTTVSGGLVPDPAYLELLESRVTEAAASAQTSLEPAELRFGRSTTSGVAFNRRPMYAGEEVGTHGPMWVDDYIGLEGPADEELQALFALRSDGSIVGGLVNFACHLHAMGETPAYSADVPGALCEALANRHGGTFLFLQGASGNTSWHDMSTPPAWLDPADPAASFFSPSELEDVLELVRSKAGALLDASEAARASSRPIGGKGIQSSHRTIEIEQRAPTSEQLELAYWFLAQDPAAVDLDDLNRRMTGHAFTFFYNEAMDSQTWFAREAVGMWWRNAFRPPPESIEVTVLALGDVAFVTYPGEMFTEFGLRTKSSSPFPDTVVCGIANGWFGYIPTAEAFEHGGYETRLAISSRLSPDAGDRLTDTALDLLGQLRQRD